MKSIKIAGLCLVAMFTMSMALAGNASAAPLWLLCLEGKEGVPPTKYTTNQCTTAAKENKGKWESVAIGNKTDTVRIKVFSLRLRDKNTLAGESEIECNSDLTKDAGEGTITGPNKAQIVKAEINKTEVNKRCTVLKGGCNTGEIEEVHGVHLPWSTTIEEVGGEVVGKIENSGAGEPGWAIKCNTILGSKTDTCTSINKEYEGLSLNTNLVSNGVLLVRNIFRKLFNAECSESTGKRAGQVEGLAAVLLVNGNGISINRV